MGPVKLMSSSLKNLPKSQIELTFSLQPDALLAAREGAFTKFAPQIKVPGFRPGKAPRHLLEDRVNPSALVQEALDVVLNQEYQKALKEHDIHPVAQPEITLESSDLTKPILVKAKVTIRPEVEIGAYGEIKVAKKKAVVDEAKIDETLQTIFERSQKEAREATDSEPSSAPTLLSSSGEPLSTPPDATINEDWAKNMGFDTLEALRTQVRQDLEGAEKYETDSAWQNDILDALISMTKVDLPDAFIEDELSRMREHYEHQLAAMGYSMEQYVEQSGKSQEEMEEQWRPQAIKQATMEVALAEIANREKIELSEEELDAELAKADAATRTKFRDPDQRYYLSYTLWRQKVLHHLLEMVERNGEA